MTGGWPRALAVGLALLATSGPAQRSILEGARFEGMELIASEGTRITQEMRARESHVSADGLSIVCRDVLIVVHGAEGEEPITVRGPLARYFHAMPDPPVVDPTVVVEIAEEDLALQIFGSFEVVRGEDAPTIAGATRRDFLLVDPSGGLGIEVDFGTEGTVRARALYWSNAAKRFVCPGPFEQSARFPDGQVVIRGTGFVADRDFADWWYPVVGDEPVTLEFQGGAS
ncbi:MAG: hypothetical protein KF858_06205 [Candidatus Sumerlaeia bacterium]|nr:hypothetical protein [Candidatus Sumerlaeia bacterium]